MSENWQTSSCQWYKAAATANVGTHCRSGLEPGPGQITWELSSIILTMLMQFDYIQRAKTCIRRLLRVLRTVALADQREELAKKSAPIH